jgi:hypothetical protein
MTSLNKPDELISEEERLKQNALFNLDFEEYKKQVKKEMKEEVVDYSKIKYLDNYCKEPETNSYLYIGISMIVFAIILMLLL